VPEVASVTFDTNLNFNASDLLDIKTWKVGGQVEFLDGLFYQDISVFEKELTGRVLGAFNRRTEVFEASIFDTLPELKQIGLNVTVKARDGFKLRNRIERFDLDMEFRFQLLLYNTLSDLRVAGDIEVVDGAIIFQGKRFNVRTGLVRFKGQPDNPYIDVVAGADIRNICKDSVEAQELTPPIALTTNTNDDTQDIYHIVLNVRGELDKLSLLYESIPYVDQRDVISLILTGCTVDLLTASSASQPTLETILGPLIGRLEREIQDVVKVEEFSIVPGVERTQVRISDSLTRRLSWRLQLDTQYNDASGQYSQLEYKLTDRLALQLSEGTTTDQNQTNANTRLTIDLKLKYRIDLD
jgi:autotransporter translocation and assembly factor TamB